MISARICHTRVYKAVAMIDIRFLYSIVPGKIDLIQCLYRFNKCDVYYNKHCVFSSYLPMTLKLYQ